MSMEVVETRQEQSVLQEASVVTHDQERINIKVEKCMEVVDTDQEQSVLQEASIAIHDQEIMKIKEEICVEEVDANQEQSVLQEASVVVNDKNLMKITEENSAIMGINDIPQERSLMQESPPGHNNDTVMKIQKENYSNESNDQPKSVVSSDKKEDKEDPDLYLYTTLNDFTSEIFKIEVNNLPNYVGYNQLQKLLKFTLKLDPRKVKAIDRNHHFAYITFKNEKDRDQALNLLNGYEWKGKTLTAKKASPSADPMAKKRKAGNSEDCPDSKHIKLEEDSIELSLKDAVIPYWNLSYEEQLKKKEDTAHKFLMKLSKEIEKNNPSFRPLLSKFRKANHHQCCPLAPIKPSPITKGYRNKCEFTVGRHLLTKEKTVGFRLSSYKKGSMSVAGPDVCFNMSEDMLKAVKSFEAYVRESDKDVYNPENHAGYWRQLTVRTSNNADILLIVVMHPQSLSEAEIEEEKTKLKKYFTDGPGSSCKITSIYFHLLSKRAAHEESTALTHLMGKKFLEITLLEMTFQVSPEAFFQINVPATEILYSAVADLVNASSSATVLDICCGTGTISLCLAKAGAKVIGIEMCPEAVENARLNAKNNGLPDVEFICGKAEDVIIPAIQKCDTSEIIAVVDPPRAGLHPKVLKVIRSTAKIQKLIYVSCHPDAALQNFINLCRTPSNAYKGCAFYPVQAMVVDLFPQTTHKELVMVFERSDRLQT